MLKRFPLLTAVLAAVITGCGGNSGGDPDPEMPRAPIQVSGTVRDFAGTGEANGPWTVRVLDSVAALNGSTVGEDATESDARGAFSLDAVDVEKELTLTVATDDGALSRGRYFPTATVLAMYPPPVSNPKTDVSGATVVALSNETVEAWQALLAPSTYDLAISGFVFGVVMDPGGNALPHASVQLATGGDPLRVVYPRADGPETGNAGQYVVYDVRLQHPTLERVQAGELRLTAVVDGYSCGTRTALINPEGALFVPIVCTP